MDKRLTVIIPGYNTREEWWRRCVESVRKACGSHDEIICVDDGSKVPVQKNWVGMDVDARVRLIRKQNGGLASARNAGMDLMQGKYVTFVDSDDEVMPEAFERCVKAIESNDADIAVYGVKVIWVGENLCKVDKLPDCYYGALTPEHVLALQKANLLNYACNKIYRKDFINGISFDPIGMPCEDIVFNLNCIMAGAKWVNVDYVGYVYYRTDGTLLSSYNPSCGKGIVAGAKAWEKYALTLEGNERENFKRFYEMPEVAMARAQWMNIWRKNTPYSFVARWKWLAAHRELGGWMLLVKTALFFVFRRCLYTTSIRRWHIRRMYPNAFTIKKIV